ncbi:hypothetical protein ACFQ07_01600 [Actinomadura adrarensis]|uniref:HNH endonuclease n=1 Tax=Actinomadura adrarensis TaxID=1819600 RepID=A0ABW3C8Y8_9ACTN
MPGNSVITRAVNASGGFPKSKKPTWDPGKYPGLVSSKPGKKPSKNALRGKIGNDLSVAAMRKRGERRLASEVNVRAPGTGLKGSTNIDHVVRGTDRRRHGVEVKVGGGKLTKNQEEHYPKIPGGGRELGSDSLAPGLRKGQILNPGDIASMRVERWAIDTLPDDVKTALQNHTVDDVLKGNAGANEKALLDNWLSAPGSRTIDKVWT